MTYDDNDSDGRFPDDSRVEVRYPRTRQEKHGDRAAWPWLPGSITEQCGPDEWQVCVEDRDVAVLRDGRRAPRNAASRNLYYPMCYRDSSEIRRRPAPAVSRPSTLTVRQGSTPAVQDHYAGGAQGAVAVTGNRMIRAASTVAVCMTAGFAPIVSYTGTYALGRGHGQDAAAARILPLTPDALIVAASLVLLHEARNGQAAPALARVMLWLGITAMAGADIASSARYGLPGAVIAAWPAVACAGAAELAMESVRRSRAPRHGSGPVPGTVVPADVQQAVRAAYAASVQAGTPLSQRAMAARFALSRRKIRQLVPESTVSGNGHLGEGEAA